MIRVPLTVLILALQGAAIRFEPIQPNLFAAGGAFVNAWADYDGDLAVDVFVGFNGATPSRLYRNELRAAGTFRDVAPLVGLAESRAVRAAAWADFDEDGRMDLLVGYTPGSSSLLKLYRNSGSVMAATAGSNGSFVDVTDAVGLTVMTGAVRQPAFVDFDGDGDLDLFVAFRDRPNAMYRNTGGRFVDVASEVGLADARKSVGAVWFDYDQDGDLDLYVANMDGDPNGLFRNDKGRFVDVAAAAGVAWGGRAANDPSSGTVRPCVADVNNDGLFDIFTANYGPNGLFLAQRDHTFEDVSRAWGVAIDGHYDTCIFGDVNNDGRVDVYVNGTITGGVQYPDYLLINTGTRFEDRTPPDVRALNADHGAAWVDADGDGNLDLALTGSQPTGMHSVLRNLTPGPDARSIRVRTAGPRAWPQAGAEVRAYQRGTRRLIASSLVDSGSGYDMQNALPVHLGIGSLKESEVAIEVIWPALGLRKPAVGLIWKPPS
ncbi:MAG: CRTAC1 family protein [Acidobacteria bacterium]|nr:MAG: CRTAC1 family protein [Acidobacteriota bacterium]